MVNQKSRSDAVFAHITGLMSAAGVTMTECGQKKILRLLCDGRRHGRDEVRESVRDSQATLHNVIQVVSRLRAKLNSVGHDIICEYEYKYYYYRLVPYFREGSHMDSAKYIGVY